MDKNKVPWESIYKKTSGRQPRELLLEVLKRFGQEAFESPRQAIDLGSGDGTESAHLLANGWRVLAIDSEPAAFDSLRAKISPEVEGLLQTQLASFEAVQLLPADLFYASYSLPFCHPLHFEALWKLIVANIKPGGRFAGQFFGVNDTWATNEDMTFFTIDGAKALFEGFEIEHFYEEDEDGASTLGPKHWHVFHIIARKIEG